MLIIYLYTVFESFLFPESFFAETQFNPAFLDQKKFTITAGSEIRFGLTELTTYQLNMQLASYGISLISFGNELYRENVAELGLGIPILDELTSGVSISVLNYWISDHYSEISYSVKAGLVSRFGAVEITAWLSNLNVPTFTDVDYVPPCYSVGCGYQANSDLILNFQVRGIETEMPFFNFNVHYSPYQLIDLVVGVNTEPLLLQYGVNIPFSKFFVTYAGNNHRQLGFSHYIGLGYIL